MSAIFKLNNVRHVRVFNRNLHQNAAVDGRAKLLFVRPLRALLQSNPAYPTGHRTLF